MATLIEALAHFDLSNTSLDGTKARTTCPLCGYRDAQWYADVTGTFEKAYCVGCGDLFRETKRRFCNGRGREDPIRPSDAIIRKWLRDPKHYLRDSNDFDSVSMSYLEGRGISRRVAKSGYFVDHRAEDEDHRWMVTPMQRSADKPLSGFMDAHMTKLVRKDGSWVRDRDAVEPYRRFSGTRSPNDVVRFGTWEGVTKLVIGEGIETTLSYIQWSIRKSGLSHRRWRQDAHPDTGFGAACGAHGIREFMPPEWIDGGKRVRIEDVILLADNDAAGRDATESAGKRLSNSGVRVRVRGTTAKDYNDLLQSRK